MKIKFKIQYMFILLSICFISCEKEDDITTTSLSTKNRLRTVSPNEVAASFTNQFQQKSTETSWLKPYFEYNDEIALINSSEKITVTPVVADLPNAYSRLFSLEIDGELQTVVYHMFASDNTTAQNFTGRVIVSSVSGEIISGFEIAENEFLTYYPIKEAGIEVNVLNNGNPCDFCDDNDWPDIDIIAPPPTVPIANFYLAWLFSVPEIEDEGEGASPVQDSPELGGGSGQDANQNPCPPNQIKDDNGNCIEPLEEEEEEEENICDEIENLINDQAFKDKMEELDSLTSGNFERGYTMTKNADGSFSYSDPFNGAPNSGQVSVTVNGQISGFIHNHNAGDGMLSIFSLGDIVDNLGFWHQNGYIDNTDTFVFGVVTFGGTYLLSISDVSAFDNFLSNVDGAMSAYEGLFGAYVKPTNTYTENELGFLDFLNLNNTGLTLYKGNTDNFNQWNRAVINRNGNGINEIQNCN